MPTKLVRSELGGGWREDWGRVTSVVPNPPCLPSVKWHGAQTAAACVPPLFEWIYMWTLKTTGGESSVIVCACVCVCVYSKKRGT